jgi:hypothetical protein
MNRICGGYTNGLHAQGNEVLTEDIKMKENSYILIKTVFIQ